MEGFPSKLGGEVHNYSYSSSTQPLASTAPPPPCPITSTPSYMPHTANQPESDVGLGPAQVLTGPGPSLQGDLREANSMTGGGGRKKKKKHKSGEDSNTSTKSTIMSEEELVDAAIPVLSENQGVEELVLPSTLPPQSETLVAGQYLLNNTLLDHILTEKKMQILKSPDVIEYLKKQMGKK